MKRQNLVRARTRLGMSQERMARYIGISVSHWRQIETGHRTPSLALATRIANKVGETLDELFVPENVNN